MTNGATAVVTCDFCNFYAPLEQYAGTLPSPRRDELLAYSREAAQHPHLVLQAYILRRHGGRLI
jgi:hypothetical protein